MPPPLPLVLEWYMCPTIHENLHDNHIMSPPTVSASMMHTTIFKNLYSQHRKPASWHVHTSSAVCLVPSIARTEEYWPEYCSCENVVNMASNIDIREEWLRSRRDEKPGLN